MYLSLVSDNGKGLPNDFNYGFGLLGMTERVRQLGGTLKIINAPLSGVIVQAQIPGLVTIAEPVHADSSH